MSRWPDNFNAIVPAEPKLLRQLLYLDSLSAQGLGEELRCTPLVRPLKKGFVRIGCADLTLLDDFGDSIDMINVIMAYDDRIYLRYPLPIQKWHHRPLPDIAPVQRTCIEQNIGSPGKLNEYCLSVSDIQTGKP